jgi:hypothetical protein
MRFNVRIICNQYQEMSVDEIDTGVMDNDQSRELAMSMIAAADELLCGIDDDASDALTAITEKLSA